MTTDPQTMRANLLGSPPDTAFAFFVLGPAAAGDAVERFLRQGNWLP